MVTTNRTDLWTAEQLAFAIARRLDGWTLAQIGAALGRGDKGVYWKLKLAGVRGVVRKAPGTGKLCRACRHCARVRDIRGRGLCWRCHTDKEISRLYPKAEEYWHEPTEAELDVMIAEQLQPDNLPRWWAAECERMRQLECGAGVSDAVLRERSATLLRGRGLSGTHRRVAARQPATDAAYGRQW